MFRKATWATAARFYRDKLGDFLQFRFKPSMDLLVVLVTFLVLHICVSITWQIVTMANAVVFFLLWGPVSMFAAGIVVPIAYNSLVKKRPLSEMGISKKHWKKSLVLSLIVLAIVSSNSSNARAYARIPPFMELLPLISFEIVSGLFFAMFFQCWAQLRFEKAFGAIPAILIAAALFSLHHISYAGYSAYIPQIWFLFSCGTLGSIVFRITRNILILWPFPISATGLFNELAGGFRLPFEYTYGFIGILALMWLFIAIVHWRQKK